MRIERIENGFTLTYQDPELAAKNRASEHWIESERTKAFPDEDALLAGIRELLPTLNQIQEDKDDYAAAFDEATKEE